MAARLRRSNIDASKGSVEEVERIVRQIRKKWRRTRIVLRADSGFARDELMSWCEANRVDYVFGVARNERLEKKLAPALQEACRASKKSDQAARVFDDFSWSTKDSWSRRRRIIACPLGDAQRQGRVDDAGSQSALHRDFAQGKAVGGTGALRGSLLRPRRHGKPDQGVPARPLR